MGHRQLPMSEIQRSQILESDPAADTKKVILMQVLTNLTRGTPPVHVGVREHAGGIQSANFA